ncbi:bifunctional purine biosynthesis protein PurH [Actinomycetota bacterium]|nr:bifunctional purine biosynthesis protein PurH [Actinomycetota bacterium]
MLNLLDNTTKKPIKRALVSVFDKSNLDVLAKIFVDNSIEVVSTGSTASVLSGFGVDVTTVDSLTGFPECLDGRVKTLHPKVHAGILADLRLDDHKKQLQDLEIAAFDLVVVNLYPFSDTVASGASFQDCIEKIDIGGPSMVRAAAKNFANVAVVVSPAEYEQLGVDIASGGLTEQSRFKLSKAAFEHTAAYDVAVANWFNTKDSADLPQWYGRTWTLKNSLRYGENSHQAAAIYDNEGASEFKNLIARSEQLNGKEMSFNNYVDLDAALRTVYDFSTTACAVVKHANPCGLAIGDTVLEAYQKAFACDPVSAYGGVIAFNSEVSAEAAEAIKPVFTEAIIAPNYSDQALAILQTKKNLRVLKLENTDFCSHSDMQSINADVKAPREIKEISGGLLLQERDVFQAQGDQVENWELVAGEPASPEVLKDLEFAWHSVRAVKSNAILLAKDGATVGIGMGQVNRIDSCKLAIERANTLGVAVQGSQADSAGGASNATSTGESSAPERARGSVAASDAFFPFADGLGYLIEAGITAVVHPGGSIRDEEVIEAAKAAGVTMYLTKTRHFFH